MESSNSFLEQVREVRALDQRLSSPTSLESPLLGAKELVESVQTLPKTDDDVEFAIKNLNSGWALPKVLILEDVEKQKEQWKTRRSRHG